MEGFCFLLESYADGSGGICIQNRMNDIGESKLSKFPFKITDQEERKR